MYTNKTTKKIVSDFDYQFVPNEEKDDYLFTPGYSTKSGSSGVEEVPETAPEETPEEVVEEVPARAKKGKAAKKK